MPRSSRRSASSCSPLSRLSRRVAHRGAVLPARVSRRGRVKVVLPEGNTVLPEASTGEAAARHRWISTRRPEQEADLRVSRPGFREASTAARRDSSTEARADRSGRPCRTAWLRRRPTVGGGSQAEASVCAGFPRGSSSGCRWFRSRRPSRIQRRRVLRTLVGMDGTRSRRADRASAHPRSKSSVRSAGVDLDGNARSPRSLGAPLCFVGCPWDGSDARGGPWLHVSRRPRSVSAGCPG